MWTHSYVTLHTRVVLEGIRWLYYISSKPEYPQCTLQPYKAYKVRDLDHGLAPTGSKFGCRKDRSYLVAIIRPKTPSSSFILAYGLGMGFVYGLNRGRLFPRSILPWSSIHDLCSGDAILLSCNSAFDGCGEAVDIVLIELNGVVSCSDGLPLLALLRVGLSMVVACSMGLAGNLSW